MEEAALGWARSLDGEDNESVGHTTVVAYPLSKRPLVRSRRRWKDLIKMYLRKKKL
jgi:hypothetical protein